MNDRFKFKGYWYNDTLKEWRVYDKPEFITGDGTAEIWYNTEGGAQPELPSKAELHLCQCTGLKDKNNKSIFEGDILKQPDGIIDYVYWSDGCYIHNGTAITNYDICYQGDTWAKEVNTHEVIGNIYENKELLESEE